MYHLSHCKFVRGKCGEAEALAKSTYDKIKVVLGPRHPLTLRTLQLFAEIVQRQGRYAQAEALLKLCLELKREELGDRHVDVICFE